MNNFREQFISISNIKFHRLASKHSAEVDIIISLLILWILHFHCTVFMQIFSVLHHMNEQRFRLSAAGLFNVGMDLLPSVSYIVLLFAFVKIKIVNYFFNDLIIDHR